MFGSLCLVFVCRGRYGLGGAVLLFILGSNLGGVGRERVLGGEEEGGGVRSRPGVARTILLFHTISVTKAVSYGNLEIRTWK